VNPPVPRVLFGVRLAVAALWLFEGLRLKVIAEDTHELKIVQTATQAFHLPGLQTMVGIGLGETVLAVAVASGLWAKTLAWLQAAVLLLLNLLGILLGGGEIGSPISLLVHNLPTFACLAILATCGAGSWRRER
jgi:uncharacterized membrane protein YphA (DoxX/SURF4 family)